MGVCIEDYVPNSIDGLSSTSGTPATQTRRRRPPSTSPRRCTGPAPMLDLNPDANDGDDPTGFKLGGGWDCTGFGVASPVGEDTNTAGLADAFILCNADLANPDRDLSANPGLLATIEFTARAPALTPSTSVPSTTPTKQRQLPGRAGRRGGPLRHGGPAEQVGCFGATVVKYSPAVGGWRDSRPSLASRVWRLMRSLGGPAGRLPATVLWQAGWRRWWLWPRACGTPGGCGSGSPTSPPGSGARGRASAGAAAAWRGGPPGRSVAPSL